MVKQRLEEEGSAKQLEYLQFLEGIVEQARAAQDQTIYRRQAQYSPQSPFPIANIRLKGSQIAIRTAQSDCGCLFEDMRG
jgi:hypothetical protein